MKGGRSCLRRTRPTGYLVATLALLPACRDAGPPSSQPVVHVEHVGCEGVRRGPVCLLPDEGAELVVFLPDALGLPSAVVTATGALAPAARERIAVGTRLRLHVTPAARFVRLAWTRPARHWQMTIERQPKCAPVAAAAERARTGDRAGARDLLRAALAHEKGEGRARVLAAQARLELQERDVDRAIATLSQSVQAARASGLLSQALKDAVALSYALINYKQDFTAARRVLTEVRPLAEQAPEHILALRYNEGGLATQTGDLREALAAFRETFARADRLGRAAFARSARRNWAVTLKRLGRVDEAIAIQQELVQANVADTPCDRSDDLVNLALARMAAPPDVAAPSGDDLMAEPARLLARAEQALVSCPDPFRRRNLLIEQLLLAVERHDAAQARAIELRLLAIEGGSSPLLAAWQDDARARLALLTGAWRRALSLFEAEEAVATTLGLAEERFRAIVGQGLSHRRGGRQRQAAAAFARAEQALDELAGRVPMGQGLAAFTSRHRDSVQALVTALLELGQPAAAMAAARVAASRALALAALAPRVARLDVHGRARWEAAISRYNQLRTALEARHAEWDAPADVLVARRAREKDQQIELEAALDAVYRATGDRPPATRRQLRQPRAGEIDLLFFPLRERWLGFVALPGGRVFARPLVLPPHEVSALQTETLAEALLGPFAREIAAARHINLLVPAGLWSLDFAGLRFRGRPLVEHATLSYRLDACLAEAGCQPDDDDDASTQSALVVSDPRLDLAGARQEIESVHATLVRAGIAHEGLAGRDATHTEVVRRLATASHLHYAGHGRFAGEDGHESALLLAENTQLLLGDILALTRAPRRVVLSACEGARLDPGVGGLSLAHAFVAAGAHVVVAASRAVPDATSQALTQALYQAGIADPAIDAAQALQQAQKRVARAGDPSPWAFRLIAP